MEKQVIKGFIEVTEAFSNKRVLVNCYNYQFAEQFNGTCSVSSSSNEDIYIDTKETYEEVIKLIQESLNEDKLKQYQ